MRLAAIQLRVVPGQRSANLRAALRAIESAAAADPSPEIIVLPCLAEYLGNSAGCVEPLAGPTAAAFAAAAREWGVYLAVGLTLRIDAAAQRTGLLFDLDGDVILTQPAMHDASLTPAVAVRKTLLGEVALLLGDDLLNAAAWDAAKQAGAKLILGCAAWPPSIASPEATIADHARRAGLWTVMADVAVDNKKHRAPGVTCLIAPDGRIVARAPADQTHVCAVRTSRVAAQCKNAPPSRAPPFKGGGKKRRR